ncbi:MAG: BamA/TamA family outer membrane protein, partial [Myxococcales bacterium]|nr:BamA/TamA family outer membrane protein [Myxococcales bacterium]
MILAAALSAAALLTAPSRAQAAPEPAPAEPGVVGPDAPEIVEIVAPEAPPKPEPPPSEPALPADESDTDDDHEQTEGDAEDPEQDPDAEPGKKGKKAKKKRDPNDPHRLEYGVLPATAYDIDLGLGFGVLVTLAKFHPKYQPYRWRLEMLLYATVKRTPGVGYGLPFHDDYIKGDFPGLLNGRLRINAAVRFRRFTNQGWYGLGNISANPEPWTDIDPETDQAAYREARLYNRYDRIYPAFDFNTRFILWDRSQLGNDVPRPCGSKRRERCPPYAYGRPGSPREPVAHKRRLEALLGTSFAYNFINPYPNSKLVEDIAASEVDDADGRTLQGLLHGTQDHALLTLNFGLLYDSRDHEYTPTRGSFTELSGRFSPGVDKGLVFGELFLGHAAFIPLYDEYLVLGARGAIDLLFGKPPIYELGRYGVLSPVDGPGGSWSIRGVPRQRYFGKQKAVLNVELRSMFYRFNIRSQRFGIGALAFVDAGRLWTDYEPVTLAGQNIDGSFWDLKLGVGGGLRITWGETLVIRV